MGENLLLAGGELGFGGRGSAGEADDGAARWNSAQVSRANQAGGAMACKGEAGGGPRSA